MGERFRVRFWIVLVTGCNVIAANYNFSSRIRGQQTPPRP